MPIYSLAKLLAPVITYQDRLRPAFVLVRVDLRPLTSPPRGNWKETWQQALEILRRCVYLDKDLVLPPMGISGATETFFVVASTNMDRSGVMTTRIREQLERMSDLKAKCSLTITSIPLDLPSDHVAKDVAQQVQAVADSVTLAIMASVERKLSFAAKSKPDSN